MWQALGALARSQSNAFAALALDRASEVRGQGVGKLSTGCAFEVLLDSEGHVLVERCEASGGVWPRVDLAEASLFLGRHSGNWYFARLIEAEVRDQLASERGAEWVDLRRFALRADALSGGIAGYARCMFHWHIRHRFCGLCGSPNHSEMDGHRMRCSNPDCRAEHFPRIDPAIIVVVLDGERALLGRQKSWPAGRYSALAGFVEPGESLEHALVREVREESGIEVADCSYFASQPWPFPGSLMLGFLATAATRDVVIGDELEDARWFDPDTFIAMVQRKELLASAPVSIAFRLIEHWLRQSRGVELTELMQWH